MVKKEFLQGMRPWHYYYQIKNPIDFAIRNQVRWDRPINKEENALFTSILSKYSPELKLSLKQCIKTFHLDDIRLPFHDSLVVVNLYYLELLIQAFTNINVALPDPLYAVDVGPSDWFYLPALASFLRYFDCDMGRETHIEGYEIDPYRVYSNFHARHNIAEQRVQAFEHVQYHLQAFDAKPDHYDVALQCFPFLFLKDHLSWGLPGNLFDPIKLMQDVAVSLKENGVLIIINQGLDENQVQKRILSEVGLHVIKEFQFLSEYKHYDHEHYVLVVKK